MKKRTLLEALSLLPLYLFLHQKATSTLTLKQGLQWANFSLALGVRGRPPRTPIHSSTLE